MTRARGSAIWAAAAGLACLSAPAQAQPANTLDELYAALASCSTLRSPPAAWVGSVMTVRFSLWIDGELKGPPRTTYARATGSKQDRADFLAAAKKAVASCFPLPITGGLGGAIQSRIILLTVQVPGPNEARMPLNQY